MNGILLIQLDPGIRMMRYQNYSAIVLCLYSLFHPQANGRFHIVHLT